MRNKNIFKASILLWLAALTLTSCAGTKGETGPKGEQGAPGETGPQGPSGKDGSDGKNGNSVLTGNGEPSYELGNNGDSYIDIDTWNFYVKENDEWVLKGNISGQDVVYYTVSFDSNGGSPVDSQSVAKGTRAKRPESPIREGYTLVDWVDENGDHWIFNNYSITSDITLFAVWEPNNYTITLDSNGGSVSESTLLVTYDKEFVLPNAIRDGYVFGGWYLDDQEVSSGIYTYAKDITLKAEWDPLFIIHFDSNGGNPIDDYAGYLTFEVESLPIPERDSHQFVGWYYEDTLVEAPFVYNYQFYEITLVAVWEKVSEDFIIHSISSEEVEITGYIGDATNLVIPSTLEGKTVVSISNEAFKNNDKLASLSLPSELNSIGDEAFSNMASLETLVINSKCQTIGENILINSQGIHNITLDTTSFTLLSFFDYDESNVPQNLNLTLRYNEDNYVAPSNGILKNATGSLTIDIILDESWISIPQYTFNEIKCIETITMSNNTETLGFGAFRYCEKLKEVHLSESVTSITQVSFYGCSKLVDINLNENITAIGNNAFTRCSSLKNIILPSNLLSLGGGAFAECTRLQSVTIPAGITSINGSTFASCSSLQYISLPNEVSIIGSNAFNGCTKLSSILIPASVETIGGEAFKNCKMLKMVFYTGNLNQWNKISLGSNNEYLTNASFEYNSLVTYLDSFTCSEYSYIYTNDNRILNFKGIDSSITSLDFNEIEDISGKTLSYLSVEAFYSFRSLETVILPDSLSSISQYCFSNCTSLTSIHFPSSLKTIEYSAFVGCHSLSMVDIPDSVENIDDLAFASSNGISTLKIGKNVREIKQYAFAYCRKLETISYNGTTEEWSNIILGKGWNSDVPASKVVCTNGIIEL